jgi:hypothetical protein
MDIHEELPEVPDLERLSSKSLFRSDGEEGLRNYAARSGAGKGS